MCNARYSDVRGWWTGRPARSVRGTRQRGALASGEGAEGKVSDTTPLIANSCKKSHKGHKHKGAHK